MAVVFLLGPSQWDGDRGQQRNSPMEVRRQMQAIFSDHGHRALLMEEVSDREGEDLIEKFDRILDDHPVTDIVLYWPKGAKMQTTYDELILLRDRVRTKSLPTIWVLHQEDVARITKDEFHVLEPGGRSRYLEAVARLGVSPIAWRSYDHLLDVTILLAQEL